MSFALVAMMSLAMGRPMLLANQPANSEINRRNNKPYRRALHVAGRSDQREVRVEVVCHLREDSCPADGVDGRDVVRGVHIGVGEEGFDYVSVG